MMYRASAALRLGLADRKAAFTGTGPSRPDFSRPYYAQIEYIVPKETAVPIAGIYGPQDFDRRVDHSSILRPHGLTAARRTAALPLPTLEWSSAVERATAHLYQRVEKVISRSNGR